MSNESKPKAILVVPSANELGRITRSGQEDTAPRWTVIHCKSEGFDAVSMARCEKNLSEAQAILMIEQKASDVDEEWVSEDVMMADGTIRRRLLID